MDKQKQEGNPEDNLLGSSQLLASRMSFIAPRKDPNIAGKGKKSGQPLNAPWVFPYWSSTIATIFTRSANDLACIFSIT